MTTITVDLKAPIALPSGQTMERVTLRGYRAIDIAKARANIANTKGFGPSCVNDPLIQALFVLRTCFVPDPTLLKVPTNWPDELGSDDLGEVSDALEAVTQGMTLEDYRERQAQLQAARSEGIDTSTF
ncbi:hypothetical protein [Deinococcus kurensis]|uniref:hypothetical protein n=1 Tax=Deinococcus kurensis TaxID=2662757 RepID=UPI0012D350D5|nr:hypothetical protein [Deinococcus kurensis]